MHLADAFSCKQWDPEPTWALMPLFLHSPVWGAAEGPPAPWPPPVGRRRRDEWGASWESWSPGSREARLGGREAADPLDTEERAEETARAQRLPFPRAISPASGGPAQALGRQKVQPSVGPTTPLFPQASRLGVPIRDS